MSQVTVLKCGAWAAVYDSTGARLFESPQGKWHRGSAQPLDTILTGLGLQVATVKELSPNNAVSDFPEHL